MIWLTWSTHQSPFQPLLNYTNITNCLLSPIYKPMARYSHIMSYPHRSDRYENGMNTSFIELNLTSKKPTCPHSNIFWTACAPIVLPAYGMPCSPLRLRLLCSRWSSSWISATGLPSVEHDQAPTLLWSKCLPRAQIWVSHPVRPSAPKPWRRRRNGSPVQS